MQPLVLNSSSKRSLVRKLRSKPEILRFEDDPLLTSLCTCLALEFEVGNPDFDRLSPFLGVDDLQAWEKTLFISDGEVGIGLRRRDGRPLQPRHSELAHLLHPSSLDDKGRLSQAILFPSKIAAAYRQRGFNLVVVRDWILSSSLSESTAVAYLRTNAWEIENRIAAIQTKMMVRQELAFFGTHDIVDHLFGCNAEGYSKLRPLHERAEHCITQVFAGPGKTSRPHLLLAYLVGVALDDLAQPRWYGSQTHAVVVEYCLEALLRQPPRRGSLQLPHSFHKVASLMRERSGGTLELVRALKRFEWDCV